MGGASIRKMLRMQARPAGRIRQGPLLIPGRVLLLFSGLLALALSVFNLFHELHAAEVDRNYTIVALAIGVVWLASIILAFRGQPVGVILTGALAFSDLGAIATAHFTSTAGAIGSYVLKEGLPVAAARDAAPVDRRRDRNPAGGPRSHRQRAPRGPSVARVRHDRGRGRRFYR